MIKIYNWTKDKVVRAWTWTKVNIKKILIGIGLVGVATAMTLIPQELPEIPEHLKLKANKTEIIGSRQIEKWERKIGMSEDGVDIYWARQQVSERLLSIKNQLPSSIEPTLGPIASGLGEIFMYAVAAEEEAVKEDGTAYTPEDLRTVQDWIIKPQLVKIPGVTEINSVGGFVREYEVVPDPGLLLSFGVTMADVVTALQRNNQNMGAGYIERSGEQYLVRSPGQVGNLDEIADIVVTKRNDAPVRIKDVAKVGFGKELRTGAATLDGEETVIGTAFMLIGENSRIVAKAVADELIEINKTLPSGVVAKPMYDRTTLVDKTIETV